MFNLEKQERLIIIFLVSSLLAGLGIAAYNRSHSAVVVEIGRFSAEHNVPGKEMPSRHFININMATAEELEKLKGVGKALAGRIVEYRLKHGLFLSKDEIKEVNGVGEALYQKIKDEITVE